MQLKLTFQNSHEFVYPFVIFFVIPSLVKKEMRCLRNEICVRLSVDYRALRGLPSYHNWGFSCGSLFMGCAYVCVIVSVSLLLGVQSVCV